MAVLAFQMWTLPPVSLEIGQDAEAVAMFADERKRLREEQGASHLVSLQQPW